MEVMIDNFYLKLVGVDYLNENQNSFRQQIQ